LVFNNSKVIPARLFVVKKETGRKGEILVLKIRNENEIEILTDKAKKYPIGTEIVFPREKIVKVIEDIEDGVKLVKSESPIFTIKYLEKNGYVPLPPYIRGKKTNSKDKKRYQTVYSKHYGSAAAPTAGLHFDKRIFKSLSAKNINHAYVSLHVGLGTFQPIYAENIEEHDIHREDFFIEKDEADKINNAVKENKKIIPVGTTSLRTIESVFNNKIITDGYGSTKLYIYPSYKFKITSGLITNFHTPKSSLLVLVSALIGYDKLMSLYKYAIEKEYRFFSYGDAMLIL
jgi:S-adenosylmethionine:tRNA ribosyltransferase-isomerase